MIGQVLSGIYRLTDLIGSGGYADVFRALDLRTNTVVAVKVLHEFVAQDPTIAARFEREANLARRIQTTHIARVLDAGQDPGSPPYIVMELVQGLTLAELLRRRGTYHVVDAAGVVDQMLIALGAAHALGIVHRDIKPQNVMIDAEGQVKVLDFGVARLAGGTMTSAGHMLGTPEYVAPEQLDGRKVDHRADLYSAGAVLYQLLSGRPPFYRYANTDIWEVIRRVRSESPPSIRQLRPDLPPDIPNVVERAMAKDAADRYQSAFEMRQALAEAAGLDPPTAQPLPKTALLPPTAEEITHVPPAQPGQPQRPRAQPGQPRIEPARPGKPRIEPLQPAQPPAQPQRSPGRPAHPRPFDVTSQPTLYGSASTPGQQPVSAAEPATRYKPRLVPTSARPVTPQQPDPEPETLIFGRPVWQVATIGVGVAVLIALGVLLGQMVPLPGSEASPTATPTRASAPTVTPVSAAAASPAPASPAASPAPDTAQAQASPLPQPPVPAATPAQGSVPAPGPAAGSRPAASATPYPPGVLFAESFDQSDSGQISARSSRPNDYTLSYAGGEYIVNKINAALTAAPSVFVDQVFDNSVLSLDVRLVGEAANRYAFVVCRDQTSAGQTEHYRASIIPAERRVILTRWDHGTQRVLSEARDDAAIRTGNASNHLELRCAGSKISVTVNGKEVASADDLTHKTGKHGFGVGTFAGVEGTVEGRFDNLEVREP